MKWESSTGPMGQLGLYKGFTFFFFPLFKGWIMVFTWIYFYWVVKCKQNILHVWHPVCKGVIYPIDSNFYRWRSGLWCSMYVLIGQRYLRCDVCPHDLLVTLFESFDGAKKFLFYCFTMVWCFWRINELGKLRCSHFNISLCNHYSKQLFTLLSF